MLISIWIVRKNCQGYIGMSIWISCVTEIKKNTQSQTNSISQRLRIQKFKQNSYLGDASLPSFFKTEHRTCLEIYVSSSLDTSVNFKSKLLLYLCFGDGTTPESTVGELENLFLGLDNRPGDPGNVPFEVRGDKLEWSFTVFFSGFIRGPLFVSNGSGCNASCSTTGFCFMSLSLAFSAARRAFSLLILINFQGSMPARKPCFLIKLEVAGSSSILMDSLLVGFWNLKASIQRGYEEWLLEMQNLIDCLNCTWFILCPLHINRDTNVGFSGESNSELSSEEKSESLNGSSSIGWFSSLIANM